MQKADGLTIVSVQRLFVVPVGLWATDGADLSGGRMPFSCGGIKRKVAVLALSIRQGAAGCRISQDGTYGTTGTWGTGAAWQGMGQERNQR